MGKLEPQPHGGALYRPDKGETPNPNGAPKGNKHLSTHIQEMLNDEDFDTFISHPTKGYVEFKGKPLKAIIIVAIRKALAGDDKAMEWLAKHGYGTKQIHEFVNNPLDQILNKFGIDNAGETPESEEGTPKKSS